VDRESSTASSDRTRTQANRRTPGTCGLLPISQTIAWARSLLPKTKTLSFENPQTFNRADPTGARRFEICMDATKARMWVLSTLARFKQIVSRIATLVILAAASSLLAATLFEGHRMVRISVVLIGILMASIVKRAVRRFDVDSLKAIETIERVFYALVAVCIFSGIYVISTDAAVRSLPGFLLISLNLITGVCAFALVKANLLNARSLAHAELRTGLDGGRRIHG
jgi:hypothetical protein